MPLVLNCWCVFWCILVAPASRSGIFSRSGVLHLLDVGERETDESARMNDMVAAI